MDKEEKVESALQTIHEAVNPNYTFEEWYEAYRPFYSEERSVRLARAAADLYPRDGVIHPARVVEAGVAGVRRLQQSKLQQSGVESSDQEEP